MKNLIIITIALFALTNCDRVTQNLAIKHNDALIEESGKVIDVFNNLNNSLATYNPDTIDIALMYYNNQINSSLVNINKVILLKDSTLKLATKNMIEVFKSVGENEFIKIRDIYTISDSLYSDEDAAEITALATTIDKKVEIAQNMQREAQKAFAKKYNFVLLSGKDTIK